jgi:hypothetical protein
VYYLPRGASQADQSLMKRIDVIHLVLRSVNAASQVSK